MANLEPPLPSAERRRSTGRHLTSRSLDLTPIQSRSNELSDSDSDEDGVEDRVADAVKSPFTPPRHRCLF